MSSRASKIRTSLTPLENTLPGSIIITVGLLLGITDYSILLKHFNTLKKLILQPMSIKQLVDLVQERVFQQKLSTEAAESIVLITDTNNVLTPMVTFLVDGIPTILRRDGIPLGVIAQAIKGQATVEFIY